MCGECQKRRWGSAGFRAGGRIEVKDEIYFQSGSSSSPTPPRWSFESVDASSYWDEEAGTTKSVKPSDRVDAWVFALQTCREPADYRPLDMSQWEFRVVPHRRLLALQQHSIGISALEAEPVAAAAVSYEGLDRAVRRAVEVNAATGEAALDGAS